MRHLLLLQGHRCSLLPPAPLTADLGPVTDSESDALWWLIFTVPGAEGSRNLVIAEHGLAWGMKCCSRAQGSRCGLCPVLLV